MSSLTRTKVVYGVKIKRGAQSNLSIDRTGLDVQEIPPELCHLTGDALSTPFPPIARGGYIKYYKMLHHQLSHTEQGIHEQETRLKGSLRETKHKRRASSASILLGPLLSHTPKPWPSTDAPAKSYLFHTRSRSSPSASPVSVTSPAPFSRPKHSLAIIPEASRETMRADANLDSKNTNTDTTNTTSEFPITTPRRKRRVISYPPSTSTTGSTSLTASALALSLPVTPPPRSSSLLAKSDSVRSTTTTASSAPASPTGSLLRRRKRQLLRTPSVENDFMRCAKELLRLAERRDSSSSSGSAISRETSSGSGSSMMEEGAERTRIPSESTTPATSFFDSSLPSSPTNANGHDGQHATDGSKDDVQKVPTTTADTPHPLPRPLLISHAKSDTSHSTETEELSEAESSASPALSTPPTSIGCGSLGDDKIKVLGDVEYDEENTRDSWASYRTAKSYIDDASLSEDEISHILAEISKVELL